MSYLQSDDVLTAIRKHQQTWPVDVLLIARDLKIKVFKSTGEASLSGKIVRDTQYGGDSGYAIFVNATHNNLRQRFTIAHEIAHFILHKDLIGDGLVDDALYRSGLSNKEEVAANKLAADILMPWHLINTAMSQGYNTVSALADIFVVSESAMAIRLGVPN